MPIKDYKKFKQKELNVELKDACAADDVELVKYLLFSPELKKHAQLESHNNWALRCANKDGEMKVLKYLLTELNANIHVEDNDLFRTACRWNKLSLVKYLTTSPELKEHANIHSRNEEGLRFACEFGNLEIIDFLFKSSDIKIKPDPYVFETNTIYDQVVYKNPFYIASCNSHLNVVNYFLYDLNYKVSPDLKEKLSALDNYNEINSIIEKRDLFFRIEENLSTKEIQLKKSKL